MLTVGYLRQAQRARLLRLSNPRRSCKPTPRVLQTIWEPGPVWDRNSPGVVRWQMEPYRRALEVQLSPKPWVPGDWRAQVMVTPEYWRGVAKCDQTVLAIKPEFEPMDRQAPPKRWPFPMAGWSKERPPEWEAPSLLDPHPCRIKRRP